MFDFRQGAKCMKDHEGVVYSEEIEQGIRLEANGVLIIGTKKDVILNAG